MIARADGTSAGAFARNTSAATATAAASAASAGGSAVKLQGFAPVTGADTRLLVLGSFPGVASLAAQRYYAHPRNQFWRLIGQALGIPLEALGYEERLHGLRQRGVGLWDVVAQAHRAGSLDADITDAVYSPLVALVDGLPALQAVAFNGGLAARVGRRQLRALGRPLTLVDLPSSSPAYTMAFERKAERWHALSRWT